MEEHPRAREKMQKENIAPEPFHKLNMVTLIEVLEILQGDR